ncbi:MAG: heme exporter protein CcmD [Pseudomonadota bacterium]
MIDLGRYAFDILLAYGITGLLVGGLVVQSILAARAARRDLQEEEE